MRKCSDTKRKCTILLAVILATAGSTVIPSFGEGILLHTQQPYSISANRTLVAEDVDPSAGVVWLKLYSRNETLKSSLLGVGSHFDYDHTDLTVKKIYAGGERDLVEIGLNNSSEANKTGHLASANTSTNVSSTANSNPLAPFKVPEKSPGFGASAFIAVVLGLGLTKRQQERNDFEAKIQD
jgi:hypothetical protein